MRAPSQYQARRLLELVSYNKAGVSEKDYIDHDVWARTYPPVQGLNFRDRATATCCLRAGGLGAVPITPQSHLPDVQSSPLPSVSANQHNMARVESTQSKLTVSTVPSFGKIDEPLSNDSLTLETPAYRGAPITEYQEFGSEALITQVQDEIDEEFDDSTPSHLFRDIGPSITFANGIHHKTSEQPAQAPLENPMSHTPDNPQSDHRSLSSGPTSQTSPHNTVASMPSTTVTSHPPPLPPFSANPLYGNELQPTKPQMQTLVIPPPPPPPLLYSVETYGLTSAVPPPPTFPPPRLDDKRIRRDTEDSSPVTEGESYDYRRDVHDEFSDLAESSVPSMRAHFDRLYPRKRMSDRDEYKRDEEEDSFGAEEVDSIEDEEYEAAVGGIGVTSSLVGRRRQRVAG